MGTLYCLHHDDEPLGSDPVPCPFCGHGAEEESPVASDEIEALGIQDSSTALQHALTRSDRPGRSAGIVSARRPNGYW